VSSTFASIVLPVYNQESHIRAILEEYVTNLQRLHMPYELLPVINGPRRDRSLEVCQELQSKFGCVRTLCIDGGGWGRAVRFGLSEARGDLLCFTNSARTTSRDLLLALVYGSVHDDAVIKANRKIRSSARRRLGSLLYNLECRALFDLPYWDVNGTPKVFSRKLSRLLELTRNDDLIDLEFNVICRLADYPVIEIPIFSSKRHSGKSTTSLRSAFHMYVGAWQLRKALAKKVPPFDQ
jgi:glycosyltransferase involved in cell wall biosynthesis